MRKRHLRAGNSAGRSIRKAVRRSLSTEATSPDVRAAVVGDASGKSTLLVAQCFMGAPAAKVVALKMVASGDAAAAAFDVAAAWPGCAENGLATGKAEEPARLSTRTLCRPSEATPMDCAASASAT